jgi:hypothetical protein
MSVVLQTFASLFILQLNSLGSKHDCSILATFSFTSNIYFWNEKHNMLFYWNYNICNPYISNSNLHSSSCKFEWFFQARKEVKWYLPWNYIMVTHIHSTSPNFSHIWTQVNKPLWIMLMVKFLGLACKQSKPHNLNTWLGIW